MAVVMLLVVAADAVGAIGSAAAQSKGGVLRALTTGIGAFYDPTHANFLTASWQGWTTDEDILRLQSELARETDAKKQMALWEQQTVSSRRMYRSEHSQH